jgi:hypothetical protein
MQGVWENKTQTKRFHRQSIVNNEPPVCHPSDQVSIGAPKIVLLYGYHDPVGTEWVRCHDGGHKVDTRHWTQKLCPTKVENFDITTFLRCIHHSCRDRLLRTQRQHTSFQHDSKLAFLAIFRFFFFFFFFAHSKTKLRIQDHF